MRVRHVVVVVAIVAAAALAAPAVGLGADLGQNPEQVDNATAANDSEQSVAFGEQVSSFAQSSASDANQSIDSGLWNVSVSTATDPAQHVHERADRLERRLATLADRIDSLDRENMSQSEYTARASALRAEMGNLRDAIDETNQTARRVGVNAENLDRLRNEASNMTGPEVSALARNITDAGRGPPAHAGPPENAGPGNESDGGPPENAGPGNESDGGPPENAGPGNESDGGPPENAGPGNGSQGPPHDRGGDDGQDSDDTDDDSGAPGEGGPPAQDDDGDSDGDADSSDGDENGDDSSDGDGDDSNDGGRGPPDRGPGNQ